MNVTFDEQPPAAQPVVEERQGAIMKLALKSGVVKTAAQARLLLIGISLAAITLALLIVFFA